MIGKVTSVLADYLAEIGFDAGKGFLINKQEEMKIRKEISRYIESQRKYNELCSLAEEIDFEGIIKYLQGNFIVDISKRLFGKKEERRAAREDIISKAVEYSAAKTKEEKKKIAKFVADTIDILRSYYRDKIGKSSLFLAAEVEDTIIEEIKNNEKQTAKNIQNYEKNLEAYINKIAPFSIDSYLHSAQKKDLETIETNLNMTLRTISCTHPLFPDYKYHYVSSERGIRMISVPTSNEAYKKCPPQIVCKGRIRVGDKYVNKFDADIVDYANRHQLMIAIDINEAKKLLGDIEDPIQLEAERLVGTTRIIPPKPFPAALPCCIKINGETVYEYIEFRTKEILDDGTYIITNEEQKDISVRISIKANLVSGQVNVNTQTVNATNRDLLQYVRYMKRACEKGKMSIYVLSLGKELVNGDLSNCDYDGGFATVDEEISFLENIVLLEEYFQKVIKIPNDIYDVDIDIIDYMIKLIKKENVALNWKGKVLTIPVTIDESIRKHLSNLEEKPQIITICGDVNINLFNETYCLRIIRTFESAVIRDLEIMKKKVEMFEDGDVLNIKYIPGTNDTLIDCLDTNSNEIDEQIQCYVKDE